MAFESEALDDDADGYSIADITRELLLSAPQVADLRRFRVLLAEASVHMNLVGPSAMTQFWRRHVLDSAQLLDFAPGCVKWADLGAGAGWF